MHCRPPLALCRRREAASNGRRKGSATSPRQQQPTQATSVLRLVLPGLLLRCVAGEVQLKTLKDYNIGYAHGSGKEEPGAAVSGSPFMIFFGRVDTPIRCAMACIHDQRCTGFVHTDGHNGDRYANTCYLRTDGCHDKSCDNKIQKQDHHESGYLYCADKPADATSARVITSQELDVCGRRP